MIKVHLCSYQFYPVERRQLLVLTPNDFKYVRLEQVDRIVVDHLGDGEEFACPRKNLLLVILTDQALLKDWRS